MGTRFRTDLERVSRSLSHLGVPTRKEIQALAKRVEELSKSVAALSGRPAANKSAQKSMLGAKANAATKQPAGRSSTKASSKRAT